MKRRQLLVAALGLPAMCLSARAGSGTHYSARLVGGEVVADRWRAGLDISLDQGWKTYWRVPGDSGVPPQFDWSRSRNVKSVTVLWPAPKRYSDAGGETIGYKDRVVFPLDVAAVDPGRPVHLALNAFLGVCEKVCIPVKLALALDQSTPAPADASLIAAFAARVPEKAGPASQFRVTDARLVQREGQYDLAVRLAGKGFDKDLDIFIECGDLAYFRKPRAADGEGLYNLRADGVVDEAKLKHRRVTLTMTAGDIRLEQELALD